MKLYVPTEANRLQTHTIYVTPGADTEGDKANVPKDWFDKDGKAIQFPVKFVRGEAIVDDDRLAKYLLDKKYARKTKLILPGDPPNA